MGREGMGREKKDSLHQSADSKFCCGNKHPQNL